MRTWFLGSGAPTPSRVPCVHRSFAFDWEILRQVQQFQRKKQHSRTQSRRSIHISDHLNFRWFLHKDEWRFSGIYQLRGAEIDLCVFRTWRWKETKSRKWTLLSSRRWKIWPTWPISTRPPFCTTSSPATAPASSMWVLIPYPIQWHWSTVVPPVTSS